jgi:hypothetical protein
MRPKEAALPKILAAGHSSLCALPGEGAVSTACMQDVVLVQVRQIRIRAGHAVVVE